MKIYRLIGIITTLQQQKTVTITRDRKSVV